MPEEDVSRDVTYINGQPVYDIDYKEPLVKPMPKSPIDFSIEQSGFLTEQMALSHAANRDLAEQNAFIVEELANTQVSNKRLAEQQACILLLLAQESKPPTNNNPEELPEETPIEPEKADEPPDEEAPIEEPIEENIPEDGEV